MIGNGEPTVSEPGQVITTGAEWYDYEAKYTEGGMELVVPAPLAPSQRERVRRIAAEAFLRSSCSGLARVDFFVAAEGIVPLIAGCADALQSDPAINRFGPPIVERWREWMPRTFG